jgi:uncharacterized protein (DUF427 family)
MFGRRPTPEPADGKAANGRDRESVWDYPRPPRIEPEGREVVVELAGEPIARSDRAVRVLETAGAPTVYLPPDDVAGGALRPAGGGSFCEWKGSASYFDVLAGELVAERAAWAYRDPTDPFRGIAGWISFYPALLDCRLDGETVLPQPGGFYGGWVTDDVVGPFKGEPGTEGW